MNLALGAAAELETVSLADALGLCVLMAEACDSRYQAAARRWLARLKELIA